MLSKSLIASSLVLASYVGPMVLSVSAEQRWATVDVNRVLNESTEAKTKKKELDALAASTKAKLEEERKALMVLNKQIKDKKLSSDSKEADRLRTEGREFERSVRDSEEDLKKRFYKLNKEVTEKALDIINDYAKSRDLDLVLDKSEALRGPILYGGKENDITGEIIAEMNSN